MSDELCILNRFSNLYSLKCTSKVNSLSLNTLFNIYHYSTFIMLFFHYVLLNIRLLMCRVNCSIVDLTFRITNCRFPTRDCIPYGEVWFVSKCHSRQGISCVRVPLRPRKWSRFRILLSKFCPFRRGPRFQRVELCIASGRTTLAVSAVAPS